MTESSVAATSVESQQPEVAHPRRLRWTLGIVTAGIFLTLSGIAGVLVALQLSHIDPAGKQADLGIVSAFGAVVAVIMNPVWGAISDRTRSRIGRRTPIVIIGSVIVVVALVVMATATSVVALAVGLCLLQFGFAAVVAPITATIPDRVPVAARGVASSILGFGIMFGALFGQIVGAGLGAVSVPLAYGVGGAVYLITAALFLVLNPEGSSVNMVRVATSPLHFLKSFWVSPRKYPDFAWAFWGRGFMFLGFGVVSTYSLYILEDYIGLSQKQALAAVPLFAIASFVGVAIAIVFSGWLSDRVQRRKPFVIAASAIAGLGIIIPLVSATLTSVVIYAFIAGMGYGCYLAVDNALITQVLPSKETAAKDLAVASIGSGAAQVISPALAALVVVSFGMYPPLFFVSLVVCVAGALCILPIKGAR
jgi:MFS family permease